MALFQNLFDRLFLPRGPLNLKNYKSGFLVSDQFLAGVSAPDPTNQYLAYIIDQNTGLQKDLLRTTNVLQAIAWLNLKPIKWTFQSTKSCGSQGKCKGNCSNHHKKGSIKGHSCSSSKSCKQL